MYDVKICSPAEIALRAVTWMRLPDFGTSNSQHALGSQLWFIRLARWKRADALPRRCRCGSRGPTGNANVLFSTTASAIENHSASNQEWGGRPNVALSRSTMTSAREASRGWSVPLERYCMASSTLSGEMSADEEQSGGDPAHLQPSSSSSSCRREDSPWPSQPSLPPDPVERRALAIR